MLPMNYGRISEGKLRRTADRKKKGSGVGWGCTNACVVIQCELVVVNDS